MPEETAANLQALLERFEKRLADPEFRKKAPALVVKQAEEKVADFTSRLAAMKASLSARPATGTGAPTTGAPPTEKALRNVFQPLDLPTFVWPERRARLNASWSQGGDSCDPTPLQEFLTAQLLLAAIQGGKQGVALQPSDADGAHILLSPREAAVVADKDQAAHMGPGVWHLSVSGDRTFSWVPHSDAERTFIADNSNYRELLETEKHATVSSLRDYLASKSFEAALTLLVCAVGDDERKEGEHA